MHENCREISLEINLRGGTLNYIGESVQHRGAVARAQPQGIHVSAGSMIYELYDSLENTLGARLLRIYN